MTDKYKFSQDYELITPQKQRSYPITTTEWSLIKKKIYEIVETANLWQTIGSILIGAAISTLIAALINDFKTDKLLWTCWFAFFVTGLSGGLSFYFGKEQRKTQNKTKEDVLDFMNIIEDRFQYTEQANSNIAQNIIIIHFAKYGAEGKFADVTSKISDLVSKNILNITANNVIVEGRDPIYGKRKALIINYTINGETKEINIPENQVGTIE